MASNSTKDETRVEEETFFEKDKRHKRETVATFLKWLIQFIFHTKHFTNIIALLIVIVVVYKEVHGMPFSDSFWLLTGTVIGFYFKRNSHR